jgi:hypothetical protein
MIIYDILKQISNYFESIVKDKQKFLIVLIGISLIFLIAIKFKPLFIILILISLGAISMIYVRFFNFAHYIGFELCTMATVLVSLAYGPSLGAITAFISLTLAFVISGYFKPKYFVSLLILPIIGLIVPFFKNLSLPLLGVLMSIVYDAIILPIYVAMRSSKVHSALIFFITHTLLNYYVFTTIAPIIYSMM